MLKEGINIFFNGYSSIITTLLKCAFFERRWAWWLTDRAKQGAMTKHPAPKIWRLWWKMGFPLPHAAYAAYAACHLPCFNIILAEIRQNFDYVPHVQTSLISYFHGLFPSQFEQTSYLFLVSIFDILIQIFLFLHFNYLWPTFCD